jgi:hypothetical protein
MRKSRGEMSPEEKIKDNKRGSIRRKRSPVKNVAERRRWANRSPEKILKDRCRNRTNKLVIRGLILKSKCEMCLNDKVEAHHHDYTKPTEVRWLCRSCHRKTHENCQNI